MSKHSAHTVERRAKPARLSLCLLSSLTLVLLVMPIGAEAAPPKPALTETNPKSSKEAPAESLEPLLIGKGEPGAETQVVRRPLLLAGSPVASSTLHPEYEIEIFAKAACAGPAVAKGTAEELEGTGIPAPAGKDALTEFSARQVDPGEPNEPSICSFARKYWEGNPPPEEEPPAGENPGGEGSPDGGGGPGGSPPGPGGVAVAPLAPRLHTSPSGPANNNAPRLVGSAPGADAVKLFANSSCSGAPVDSVSPSELAAGVVMRVPDNSSTDFAGISVGNGKQSFCSPPATYIEDSTPPRVRITMGPGAKTRRHKAVFRFADTSEEPEGTTFRCKVDRHQWKPCSSPLKLRHLRFHRYVLRVSGIDTTGNVAARPAKRSFKVIH